MNISKNGNTQDNNVYGHIVHCSLQETARNKTHAYLPTAVVCEIATTVSPIAAIILQLYFEKGTAKKFNPMDDEAVAKLSGFTLRQVSDARRALTKEGYVKVKKATFDVTGERVTHIYLGKEVCANTQTAGEFLQGKREAEVNTELLNQLNVANVEEALKTHSIETIKQTKDSVQALFGEVDVATIDGYATEVNPTVVKVETKYPNLIQLIKDTMALVNDQPTILNTVANEYNVSAKVIRSVLTKLDGVIWFSAKTEMKNTTVFKLI